MNLELLKYPHPMLTMRCKPVEEITDDIRSLAKAMCKFCDKHNAAGLAAPQVGYPIRMFVIKSMHGIYLDFINPVLYLDDKEGYIKSYESCLSCDGVYAVTRSCRVEVSFTDIRGRKSYRDRLNLCDAIVAQHEFDHLDGLLVNRFEKCEA